MARSFQLWLTLGAFGLAPLFFGSVDQLATAIWVVVLSLGVILGLSIPLGPRQARLLLVFLVGCGFYAGVAILQIVPNLSDRLADANWGKANELLGLQLPARVSARAQIPREAVGHFLLFVAGVLNGFFVGVSRRRTDRLFRVARYVILAYAAYGIAALVVTPNLVLWAPKEAYHGMLTATFINHNTAATFIGAGFILWLCRAVLSLKAIEAPSIRFLLLMPWNETFAYRALLLFAAALLCLFAELLTSSRGGLICTCLGAFLAMFLLVRKTFDFRLSYGIPAGVLVLGVIAVWLGQSGRIGSQGLFDDSRFRVYGATIDAMLARPVLGYGAGTFADIFPSVRSDDLSSWGVWEYAHSTLLEIALEMGLPVAVMILAAALGSVVILLRYAQRTKDRSEGSACAVLGVVALTYLHSLIDFSLQIPGYLIPFSILLGSGLARATAEHGESAPAV